MNNLFIQSKRPTVIRRFCRSASTHLVDQPLRKNWTTARKATRNTELALNHFDGLYSKVYGRSWPSARLGLLSPKKQCLVLNTLIDTSAISTKLIEEDGAIELGRYYKKHHQTYTRWKLRENIIANKKARRREMIAKNLNISPEAIDPETLEVSDVSDSELVGKTTDSEQEFSSAEDLLQMFSDRRLDEDEKYFINQASTHLSLNDFVPATELMYREEIPNDLAYYENFVADIDLDVDFQEELTLEFCDQLKIYTYPRGTWDIFDSPETNNESGLLTHYLMDGASILSVLALDVQPNDNCADYCAAPGGKSLAILMSLRASYLLCNDVSASRLSRLARVMRQYAPNINYLRSTLHLSRKDGRTMVYPDMFDKILVDVPCSNDRHSCEVLDNNIFRRTRTDERFQLPSVQVDILKSGLKSLRQNGSLVYSTCTMSPVENDGVVQKALMQLQEEGYGSKFAVMGLKEAFRPLRGLFKFKTSFKYGQQVLPSVCSNFGPMYISKIKRLR